MRLARSLGAASSLHDPDAHRLESARAPVALDPLSSNERQHSLVRNTGTANFQTQTWILEERQRDAVQTFEGEVLLVDHPAIAGLDDWENQHFNVRHRAAIALQNDAVELGKRALHLVSVRMQSSVEDVRSGMFCAQLSEPRWEAEARQHMRRKHRQHIRHCSTNWFLWHFPGG